MARGMPWNAGVATVIQRWHLNEAVALVGNEDSAKARAVAVVLIPRSCSLDGTQIAMASLPAMRCPSVCETT